MNWIQKLIEAHTKDGVVDFTALNEAIKAEAPNHVVPKDQYNSQAEKLKEATSTIEKLKKDNEGNAQLQKDVEEWKAKAAAKDEELKALNIKQQVKEALTAAGGLDHDYLTYKLGALELDDKGQVKDLTNKVKDLKAALPTHFEESDEEDEEDEEEGKKPATPPPGFQIIDNKAKKGDKKGGAPDPVDAIIARYNPQKK